MLTLKEDVSSLFLNRIQDALKVCCHTGVQRCHLHPVTASELQVHPLLGQVDDPVILVLDKALHLVHLKLLRIVKVVPTLHAQVPGELVGWEVWLKVGCSLCSILGHFGEHSLAFVCSLILYCR